MNILQSMIYGLLSGLSAFLPISLSGHQALTNLLLGVSSPEPIRDMLVHISIILAVFTSSRTYLYKLQQEISRPNRRKKRQERSSYSYDFLLIRSSVIPMLIGMVILKLFNVKMNSFAVLAVFFLLNGSLIYFTEHIPHGNKDGSKLSAFDGFLLGVSSALSVLPGISRIGAAMSSLLMRGADRSKAFTWMLILTIPFCIILILFDFIGLFTVGIGSFSVTVFIGYIFSGVFSYLAAFGGIYLMRFLSVQASFSVFAFYSWGAALLSFILYLNA